MRTAAYFKTVQKTINALALSQRSSRTSIPLYRTFHFTAVNMGGKEDIVTAYKVN
jgi:hypothetical protein